MSSPGVGDTHTDDFGAFGTSHGGYFPLVCPLEGRPRGLFIPLKCRFFSGVVFSCSCQTNYHVSQRAGAADLEGSLPPEEHHQAKFALPPPQEQEDNMLVLLKSS